MDCFRSPLTSLVGWMMLIVIPKQPFLTNHNAAWIFLPKKSALSGNFLQSEAYSIWQLASKIPNRNYTDCWHWIFMYSETEVFWGFCILSEVHSLWQGRDGGAQAKDSHFWARPLPLHLPSAKNAYKAGTETKFCKYTHRVGCSSLRVKTFLLLMRCVKS